MSFFSFIKKRGKELDFSKISYLLKKKKKKRRSFRLGLTNAAKS